MRFLVTATAATLLVGVAAGCGGGEPDLSGYSAGERRAIERAELILDTVYGLNVEKVTQVERDDLAVDVLWRVEVDTQDGHRCVYLSNMPSSGPPPSQPNPNALYLVSIKGGPICAEGIYIPNG